MQLLYYIVEGTNTSLKKVKVKVTQSCPALCYPMDYTVPGILQTRILEWVAFPFSRECLQAVNAGEGVEKREPSYTVGGNAN